MARTTTAKAHKRGFTKAPARVRNRTYRRRLKRNR